MMSMTGTPVLEETGRPEWSLSGNHFNSASYKIGAEMSLLIVGQMITDRLGGLSLASRLSHIRL